MINIEELGLKFGKKEIAKNGNVFKRSLPTESFWNYYKDHKDELKEAGYSVYKLDEQFYIYDWTSTEKYSYDDYIKFEAEKNQKWSERAIREYYLYAQDQDADIDVSIKTLDELKNSIEKNAVNPDSMWEYIYTNAGKITDIEYE